MKINVINGTIDVHEMDKYVKYLSEKYRGRQINAVDIILDGEFVDLKVYFKDTDFQRAFRSADYLVNNMDKLNDAKQQEFADKQRHKA